MATVKITNTLTKVIANGNEAPAVISPTGITLPCTPVQEYISDMVTITNGTLNIPAYNKVQQLSIPFGAYTEFEVTNPAEINYWENIKVDGAKVEVTDGNLAPAEEYIYTAVVFSGEGTEEDPYKPEFAADTFFEAEGADYALLDAEPADWGTAVGKYFTRKKNVLPTNNVDSE